MGRARATVLVRPRSFLLEVLAGSGSILEPEVVSRPSSRPVELGECFDGVNRTKKSDESHFAGILN